LPVMARMVCFYQSPSFLEDISIFPFFCSEPQKIE
jgi:hypothetical protein